MEICFQQRTGNRVTILFYAATIKTQQDKITEHQYNLHRDPDWNYWSETFQTIFMTRLDIKTSLACLHKLQTVAQFEGQYCVCACVYVWERECVCVYNEFTCIGMYVVTGTCHPLHVTVYLPPLRYQQNI